MGELNHLTILAAAMRSREVWSELEASGELAHVGEDMAVFSDALRDYYAADSKAQSADPELIEAATVGVTRDPKRAEVMRTTMDLLRNAGVSVPNARRAVRLIATRRVSEQLATKLLMPQKDDSGPMELIDEYLRLQTPSDTDEAPQWSREAIAPALGDPRIPIYPMSLGRRFRGGLWPGHHMTVFARPEIGKSAFAINTAVMAASRGKARVLYLSNEDSVRDLMLRALVRFTGKGHDEVLTHLEESIATAKRMGADRLLFRDMAPGSLAEIDRLVRKTQPDLFIVDQMRNIGTTGKNADNMTQRLDAVAQGLRNIAKRHDCAVISITQAGDSARDKAILDDGDVDNSNTGVSAGCDVLLGLGANAIMREAGERRVSIIKNKLGGTHGYADVRLDPVTLAFRDSGA